MGRFPLLGLEAAWPSAQPKDNKGAAAAHSCLLPLFPHSFILLCLHPEFLHRISLTVLGGGWWAAASCAGPLPPWEQGCGYLCFPWCRIQKWDPSWRWAPAVSANVGQPRFGDKGHEGLVWILLWGPLESQVEDEWECGGLSTQMLGGREGACPWLFRSTSDECELPDFWVSSGYQGAAGTGTMLFGSWMIAPCKCVGNNSCPRAFPSRCALCQEWCSRASREPISSLGLILYWCSSINNNPFA